MKLFNRKNRNPVVEAAAIAMAGGAAAVVNEGNDGAIDALIAEMGQPTIPVSTEPTTPPVAESTLEAAVAGAEIQETYAAQPGDKSPEQIAAEQKAADEKVKADAKAAKEQAKADAKVKRENERAEKKAAADAAKKVKADEKAAAKIAADAAKAATPKRIFFGGDKVGRLKHSMGESFGDYMVLTTADAALTGDDLKAKQDETVKVIEAMGSKVKNRATFLLDFVSGKTAKLNNVLSICLSTLVKDGNIVTGDKGNFHVALLAKPYAASAARAMGNNTVACFRQLKLIVASGDKQTYVANPDSLLLAAVKSKLGL